MDEAVLAGAHVHEHAEARHVRDQAGTHHPGLQVLDRAHVVAEREGDERRPRIPARLLECHHHVGPREGPELRVELRRIARERGARAEQVARGPPMPRRQGLERGVALGVDGGRVERVLAAPNPKEPGGLLEVGFGDAGHLENAAARRERAARVPVLYDRGGRGGR